MGAIKIASKNFYKYLVDTFLRSRNLKFDVLSSFFTLQMITAISIVSYTFVNNSRSLVELSDHLMEDISSSEISTIGGSFREVMGSTELGSYLVKGKRPVNPI